MDTVGERLEYFKKQNGLTYKDYGDALGITSDAIRISISRNKVREFYINIISEKFGISKSWLMDGKGDILLPKKTLSNSNDENIKNETFTDKITLRDEQINILKENINLLKEQNRILKMQLDLYIKDNDLINKINDIHELITKKAFYDLVEEHKKEISGHKK